MKQIELKYFFPLTEQIELDLDYTPCQKYDDEKRATQDANSVISSSYLMNGANGSTWAMVTSTSNLGAPLFTIDIDQMPITIVSKQKPNFIKNFIYKTLGMKWKSK
jgi:hypothetical protein